MKSLSGGHLVFIFTALIALPFVSMAQAVSQTGYLPEEPQPQSNLNLSAKLDVESSSVLDLPAGQQQPSSQTGQSPQAGQSSTSSSQASPGPQQNKKEAAQQELDTELHQRMGRVVPNFNAVLDGNTVPLEPKQKMYAAFRSAVDPYQFGIAVISAGIGQAENSHSGYGQGIEGYGKRLGASFTDQFDGTIIGNGILPVLLKQDARYFRMGTGTFSKRFFYSVSTTVRCKGDNGKWQPNYSNLLGNLAAGGISNIYYPAADRGIALTVEQAVTVTAQGIFGALLIEFYPDIRSHFHKKTPAP